MMSADFAADALMPPHALPMMPSRRWLIADDAAFLSLCCRFRCFSDFAEAAISPISCR